MVQEFIKKPVGKKKKVIKEEKNKTKPKPKQTARTIQDWMKTTSILFISDWLHREKLTSTVSWTRDNYTKEGGTWNTGYGE